MSVYETLDLIAAHQDTVNDTWNFFITVHLALIGALFVIGRRVGIFERLLAMGAYLAFSWVNYSAQLDNYAYFTELIAEVRSASPDPGGGGERLIAYYEGFDLASRIAFLPYAYVGAAIATAVALIFINAFGRARS